MPGRIQCVCAAMRVPLARQIKGLTLKIYKKMKNGPRQINLKRVCRPGRNALLWMDDLSLINGKSLCNQNN